MRWQPPVTAIVIGCLTAVTFNSLGWLQISERKLYDYYLRLRPEEPQDRQIVIVGLTEKDIEKLGFPISDDTLATLLTKIKAENPRAIGLDLHRNVDIGNEGNEKLDAIFRSTPELIGVEKTDGGNPSHQSISPPTELEKLGQTGASEIIQDEENGVVRRGYLYVQKSESTSSELSSESHDAHVDNQTKIIPSFGLAIALKYLEEENIFPSGYGKQSWLKLGNAVFPMLKSNRLFYSNTDIDNYQTIINYYNAEKNFLQVSVSEVLENKVKDNFFQNKIVLIGTTAETIKDIFKTPYSHYDLTNYNLTYGVEIHANLISQIINAALKERVMINFLPNYWQYSLLVFLLIATSFVSWYLYTNNLFGHSQKTTMYYTTFSIFIMVFVLAIGYLFLLFGWWIPTSTSLASIIGSAICLYVFIKLDRLKQANIILEQKVKERTQALEEAQKRILSQEKITLYQKISQYIAHEIKNKTNIIGLNIQNCHTDIDELQLIIEDNSFLFEEIIASEVQSPQQIILNLNNKLSRIQSINQKVTSIISEIYDRGTNNLPSCIHDNVDINQLLDTLLLDFIQICNIKYDNFNVTIYRDYDKCLNKINCPASDVERILDNIISNAIYYLYKKTSLVKNYQPCLSVSTKNESNSIEIKIRDNGIGIPSENLKNIFQIFWTTKSFGESLGLGLHFAKELIEKHGWKILVDSIEDEYTEFTIIIDSVAKK